MNKFDAANVARLERMYATPEIVEQRAHTREALALSPGEHGLDIGCGIGLLVCEMAREVGAAGRVTGVDSSSAMIAAAEDRAGREGPADATRFVCGDAAQLAFRHAAFDFVVAVQVYLYVADIERALGEASRVLRPGGRLVVVDTDWDSCVWLTSDRERHRRVLAARTRELAQPHLAPMLPGLLRRAGLTLVSVRACPVLNVRYDADSFSEGLIEVTPAIVTKYGVDAAEAEAWAKDLRARTAEGEYFFSLNRYLFVARR